MKYLLAPIALAITSHALVAQCNAPGTSLMQNGVLFDDWTAATPIGFAFPFEGATFTDVYISDHGLVALANGGTPVAPAGGAFTYTPGAVNLPLAGYNLLSPYWSDHTLQGGAATGLGELFVDNTSGTECTITWLDVETFNGTVGAGSVFNVQMTLYLTGEIEFRYDGRVNNDGSSFGALEAVVGISPDGVALGAAVDMTASPVSTSSAIFEEFVTTAAGTPNPNFDLANTTLRFLPQTPGWVVVPGSAFCASSTAYGTGCGSNVVGDANYELFDGVASTFDLSGSGQTYLWTGTGYVLIDGAGAIVPPAAGPTAFGDDDTQSVALGFAMPSPSGVVSDVSVCSNGWLSWDPTTDADLGETVLGLLDGTFSRLAFLWDDLNPSAAGSITLEAVSPNEFHITFTDVPEFGAAAGANTCQVALFDSGTVEVRYGACSLLDGMVGVSPGNGANDLGGIDYSDLAVLGAVTIDTGVGPFFAGMELASSTQPVLGANWDLTTSNIDAVSPIAITFLGDRGPAIPLSVLGFNAPGCDANLSSILGDITGVAVGGVATVSLPLPNNAALTGLNVSAQSVALTLSNAANLLTSNGVEGTLGN
ncbi:MAG: hypothetical protein AB8H80_21195 [Planctomycetota bacterium]